MSVTLDARWVGNYGIARFAREVLTRLPDSYKRTSGGSPWSPLSPDALLASKHDIFYSPGFNPRISRGAQVLTVHDLIHLDVPSESGRLKRAYYERFVRPTILRTGVVHTISDFSSLRIQDWLDDNSVRVINVGNSVSDAFNTSGPSWHYDSPTFLYVGNLKPHKNAEVLWAALKQCDGYRMEVVTSDTKEAHRLSHEYGIEGIVRVSSDLSDGELALKYRGSIGLLFPSLQEGFGLPPLEAICCGRPVAYSEGCDVVAGTVRNRGVSVSSSKDPGAWANAMNQLATFAWSDLLSSRSLAERSWDDVATSVLQSIRSL